jgi:TPR repeat protein
MKRSKNQDAELGETRAVLQRLQRFSDDPDQAEFAAAAAEAPIRPRRTALVAISAVVAVALAAAGTVVLLQPGWLGGTIADLRAPAEPKVAVVAPKAPVALPGPSAVTIDVVVPRPQKVETQIAPPSGAAKPPSAPGIAAEEKARAEQLLARGDAYLADGNVMGARDFFERAADIGLAAAALRLAETYDPGALQRLQALGVVPDPALARRWYERARELGAPEAADPLARLSAR